MWYFMSYSNSVDKIKAGEYADFAEMPPVKGKNKLLSIISPERQAVLVQVSDLSLTIKVLPDLATWAQCFECM